MFLDVNGALSIANLNSGGQIIITATGDITQTGSITASNVSNGLSISTTGAVTLTDATNNVTTLSIASTSSGDITYVDADAFIVKTFSSVVGVSAASGSVSLTATTGDITVDQDISASSGNVSVITGGNLLVNTGGAITTTGSVTLTVGGNLTVGDVTSGNQILANSDSTGAENLTITADAVTLGVGTANTSNNTVENDGTGFISIDTSGGNGTGIITVDDRSILSRDDGSTATGGIILNAGSAAILIGTAQANQEIFSDGDVTITAGSVGTGTGNSSLQIASSFSDPNGASTLKLTLNNGGDAFIETLSSDDPFSVVDVTVALAASSVSIILANSADSVTGTGGTTHSMTANLDTFSIALKYTCKSQEKSFRWAT